jgi:hypothetical protein
MEVGFTCRAFGTNDGKITRDRNGGTKIDTKMWRVDGQLLGAPASKAVAFENICGAGVGSPFVVPRRTDNGCISGDSDTSPKNSGDRSGIGVGFWGASGFSETSGCG